MPEARIIYYGKNFQKKGLTGWRFARILTNNKTVEGEQVLSEPSFAESRGRWDRGMENRDEWAPEGELNAQRVSEPE